MIEREGQQQRKSGPYMRVAKEVADRDARYSTSIRDCGPVAGTERPTS